MNVFFRYLAGAVAGFLVALLFSRELPDPPTPVDASRTIYAYKRMVERDDRILNVFMDNQWDRSMCYQRTPEYQLADGTWVWHLNKIVCK